MSVADQNNIPADNATGQDALRVEEIKVPVPWGHVSGKWWGPMGQMPIIALHGWQDNAGSFDLLIPYLSSHIAVFAIDLPGHGLSSHYRSGQFSYVYWQSLLCLRRVLKYYKWNKNYYLPTGKWWGSKEIQPIVALHGRQDNAGTFDALIPLLTDEISVLCLDMPGHGLSSHYPKSQYYFVHWDYTILLRRIVKYFKWNKVKLLGHSLGGAVAFLYAASYPDEVEFVIALDVAGPTIGDPTKRVHMTATIIDRFLEYDSLNPETAPTYTYEEVLEIAKSGYGDALCMKGVETLMKRGTRRCPDSGRYSFTRDSRLKVASLGMPSTDLVYAYAARIKCAYLNISAKSGIICDQPKLYHETLEIIKKGAKRFEFSEVEGTHFIHLNNPEKVASIINKFLST